MVRRTERGAKKTTEALNKINLRRAIEQAETKVEIAEPGSRAGRHPPGLMASSGSNTTHQRVILLDVDGVLHPFENDGKRFQLPNMEALALIVQATGASIVLSSSWQCIPEVVNMQQSIIGPG